MNEIDEDKFLKETVRKNIDEKAKEQKEYSKKKTEIIDGETNHINAISDKTDMISFEPWSNYEIFKEGNRADIIQDSDSYWYRIRIKVNGQQLPPSKTIGSLDKDFQEINNCSDITY